jgi:hypothetical protein
MLTWSTYSWVTLMNVYSLLHGSPFLICKIGCDQYTQRWWNTATHSDVHIESQQWEAEAGGPQVQGQPVLHRETLSQKIKTKLKKKKFPPGQADSSIHLISATS